MKFELNARKRNCRGPERAAACAAPTKSRPSSTAGRLRRCDRPRSQRHSACNLRKEAFHASVLTLDVDGATSKPSAA
jgi:hypothetical protein